MNECRRIMPEMSQNVRNNFEQILYYYMETNGGLFILIIY